ncbi:uncharacterized protein MELLADRAFT_59770 [Melampsora larici-populina 98AG31]|uniref:Uncharacterized protein n=1 Tax=Melampsora larici-populina (strain 98AG31 / pathotype 3-4-7) TaxID=747676 RepID=F4R785_MELLP|nr:uncharacterized protein MELLADRAFT_59770 [Melampsora larici-populina 98AG31]EGG11565.1 hypothetical protein MELLADRAFT_59770 [Melampsora larici-populina 98AG31]
MPSGKSYRKVYCKCISRRCGEVEYVDADGQHQLGNKIFQHLARAHQLDDKRRRVTLTNELPEEPINKPDPVAGVAGPLDTLIQNLRLSSTGIFGDESSNRLSQGSSLPISAQMESSTDQSDIQMPMQSDHALSSTSRNHGAETGRSNPDIPVHDTSSYMENHLETANPVLIFPLFVTAILVVFENISLSTANWLLSVLQGFTTLVKTYGTGCSTEETTPLTFLDQLVFDEMPRDIRTIFSNFQLDPDLIIFNTCPMCFAMYHIDHTPKACTRRVNEVPGLFQPDPPDERLLARRRYSRIFEILPYRSANMVFKTSTPGSLALLVGRI